MKKIALTLMVAAATATAASAAVLARDITGDWTWVAEIPNGTSEGTMHIERNDTIYSGTGSQPTPEGTAALTITGARVKQDSVWISVSAPFGPIAVTAAFTNDSTVVGKYTLADQSGGFSMHRKH